MGDIHFVAALESATLCQLFCNVCYNFISSPVWQCATGHNFCSCCFKDLDCCPRCRSPKGTARNYAMERLRPKIIYLFQNHNSGCQCIDSNTANLLREEIMFELKCQLCMNYMKPLVPQCVNGHSGTCKDCFDLGNKCALCLAPQATGRNLSLERLLPLMHFFCKYERFGCRYRGCGLNAVEHETFCVFAPRSCPMRFSNHCEWKGSEQEILEHCINKHKELSLGPKLGFYLKSFNVESHVHHIVICLAYGRLFRYTMYFDESEMMGSGCSYFGDSLEDGRYSYEVAILKAESNVTTKFGSICGNVVNDNFLFVYPHRIDVDYSKWTEYCDGDGNLNITLQIIDNKKTDTQC